MKERRSVGGSSWWPSSVPNPAAVAARRVSWWPRSDPAASTVQAATPQRPSSLVIVHCGPVSQPQSPASPPMQRPSCSPPPPPPPRSPAASSYATADEDDSPSPLEMPPQSADGDLLQGILALIEQKGNLAENDNNETKAADLERIRETEDDEQDAAAALVVGVSHVSCTLPSNNNIRPPPSPPPMPPLPLINNTSAIASVTPAALQDYDVLPEDLIFKRLPTNNNHESEVISTEYNNIPPDLLIVNAEKSSEPIPGASESKSVATCDNTKCDATESDIMPAEQAEMCSRAIADSAKLTLSVTPCCIQTVAAACDVSPTVQSPTDTTANPSLNVTAPIEIRVTESSKSESTKNNALMSEPATGMGLEGNTGTTTNNMDLGLGQTDLPEIKQAVVDSAVEKEMNTVEQAELGTDAVGEASKQPTPEEGEKLQIGSKGDDDSSGAGPRDTLSSSADEDVDHDGDLTLDDATDITLDDSTGSPIPPIPRESDIKPVNEEDEYFELARSGNYENIEYKRRPNALLISKRRLQALHPPRLGVVKNGLSRAWVTMRGWGSEGARKLNEWTRDSAVLQDTEPDAMSSPGLTPQSSRAPSELPTSPEGSPPPPPLQPPVTRRRSGIAARRSRYLPHEGQSGFDELRRYMKQGGDFCKELSTILQERAEAEAQYAKSLSKLSAKLSRSAKEAVGSVSAAWQQVAAEMEAESEAHRDASAALAERVVRPLRVTVEAQHRARKSVETAVDKTGKGLAEWRVAEAKAKKHSFACARENERLQDALQEAQRLGRAGRTGTLSEKEVAKLESKRRKAEESVKKADVEYYTFCIRAERARLEWETAVSRGSQCFQELEEQRLHHLKELVEAYLQLLAQLAPRIVQGAERLAQPVQECDVSRDLHTVASVKGVGQPIPEQLLPDFYPEHVTLAMNRERRRLALAKLLQLIRQDLERERRAKQGVENLARALQQTPTFGTEDSQQNVSDKLHHMRSMLTYLEAARYKVHGTLAELDGQGRASHPLAPHIQVTRDRQGFQQSILKVPPWVREESLEQLATDNNADWPDRGAADGNSVQPDSDFDEFSSQASDEKEYAEVPAVTNLSVCRALYDYTANLCDELNLRTGDVISVREKQDDGWWVGELNGIVGIFPATYVEEVEKN